VDGREGVPPLGEAAEDEFREWQRQVVRPLVKSRRREKAQAEAERMTRARFEERCQLLVPRSPGQWMVGRWLADQERQLAELDR
jgi:hypothetical protein